MILLRGLLESKEFTSTNSKMNNETVETKPLTKHISAAVNAIQKEIDKRGIYLERLIAKAKQAEEDAESLRESIAGLKEQISKLKGE